MKTAQEFLTSNVARLLLGLAVVIVVSSQVQAQQYVYYPQAAYQPTYYYVQQPATQYYQTAYAPQNYQYYYPTQYYQAPQYYQTAQTTQATAEGAGDTSVVHSAGRGCESRPSCPGGTHAELQRSVRVPFMVEFDPCIVWPGGGQLRPESVQLGGDE